MISMVFLWGVYGMAWDVCKISLYFLGGFYRLSMIFLWYFDGISLAFL